jgi:hypothetical protein
VAAATQNQALNALRVRRPATVREALSIEDTRASLGAMEDVGG